MSLSPNHNFTIFFLPTGALALPAKNAEENEVDYLAELPGEREYYRTSTDANDFVMPTYSGDGDDDTADASGYGSGDTGSGSGEGPLESPPSSLPPGPLDTYAYYFVRINIEGEETNETDRQWLDFLQSNGVDLSKIHGSGGNFGVMNLMPSADVNPQLTDNNSAIKLTEDDLFKLAQRMEAAVDNGNNTINEQKAMDILKHTPSEVPMEIPMDSKESSQEDPNDGLLIDQLNATLYEFVNESNLHIPDDNDSTEGVGGDVSSAEHSIENISLISQGERKINLNEDGGDSSSDLDITADEVDRTTHADDDASTRIHKRVENKNIDSIVKRYKVLHGWAFN